MMRRLLTLTPLLAALLLPGTTAQGYHGEEVKFDKATLREIDATLFGQAGKTGLIRARQPFKASFRNLVVSGQDAMRLVSIVSDAVDLPPDSLLEIQGHIDGEDFHVKMESNDEGRKVAKLEGLPFYDRGDVVRFLDALKSHGVREVKLEAIVGRQRVAGRIADGETRIEG